MPRALHVVEIADEHLCHVALRAADGSPGELPKRMPSGDEAPIEEARRPEGADHGGKDEQLPSRQFHQDDAPEALANFSMDTPDCFSLIIVLL
jgi:hypothetical protein